MKSIKARVLQFLAWLKGKFSAAGETIHEVSLAREYEQQEPIRAPALPTPSAGFGKSSNYKPKPERAELPHSWADPKPKTVRKPGKVVPLSAEQIQSRSKPGNRKPTRAQRRAAAKHLKDAA